MPLNLDRLPLQQRVCLTAEVLSSYTRVRWVMRDEDAEHSVHRLRTGARDSAQEPQPTSESELKLLAALRLAHATRRVLEMLPSDSRCLFRSLTLLCLLERRKISQTLVIAVRPQPFSAHAWVEVEGKPVLPDADASYERLLELSRRMLTGTWGAGASALLERIAERRGAELHRAGKLTMLSPPDFVGHRWSCWLFGEPEYRGALDDRFGFNSRGDLSAAFGRALIELGDGACELLQGRFLVVALDRERDRCLLTCDQLGAQPLVHTSFAGGVLFAEHERDLLELLPRTPSPDRLALLHWIDAGLNPPRRTLYEDVQRLAGGHRLSFNGSGARVERWWNLRYQETDEGTATILAERLREASFAAVGRAAAGSVRPAVKLSGGLDSACVAAGLAANGFADGRAIAIGGTFSDHPVSDETELIEATARHTHLALERVAFNPASRSSLRRSSTLPAGVYRRALPTCSCGSR